MIQGSAEWHEWRRNSIGASEISAVLGLNPWKSAYQLFLEKTGQAAPFQGNAATRRGQELEPVALELLKDQGWIIKPGPCIRSNAHPFLSASFDAIGFDAGDDDASEYIIEVKCPGEKQFEAMREKVPPYYYAQVQQQLLIAEEFGIGCGQAIFYVFHPELGAYRHIVASRQDYWREIIDEGRTFWDRVEMCAWPSSSISDIAAALAEAKRREAEIIEERKRIEQELMDEMKRQNIDKMEDDRFKVSLVRRKAVDKKACESIPEWQDAKRAEAEAAALRKEIEKQHMKEGPEYIRLTEKETTC